MRIKGKEVEGKDNHRNNFPVVGTSASNRSMMRQPDEIANSSKKDKEVLSYLDAGLKYRMKGNGIVCGSDMQGEVDRVMSKPSYLYSSGMNMGRAKARQIQSDEIFAHKLQEQFHHETAKLIAMEKADAKVAWSLQQNEDAKAAAPAWKPHDSTSRLDLLEAMEDVLENSDMLAYDELASNHSSNDTDYEMQLDSDESSDQHVGYSEINNLHLSFIQDDKNKEACPVCLEIPSVGETMRHLPCLHKFHKMCIDRWLKRKPSCPVCKFKIT